MTVHCVVHRVVVLLLACATLLSAVDGSSPDILLPEGVSNEAFTLAGVDVGEALCSTCKKVVRTVDQVLRLNATKQELFQSATARLCSFLPEAEQTACTVLSKRTNPAVYQCVLHAVGAQTICSDARVSLCPATNVEANSAAHHCPEHSLQSDPQLCAGCEFSIGALQLYMNHSAASLVRAFQRDICLEHFETGTEAAVCSEMLSLFGGLLVKTAISRIDAGGICCKVGVC